MSTVRIHSRKDSGSGSWSARGKNITNSVLACQNWYWVNTTSFDRDPQNNDNSGLQNANSSCHFGGSQLPFPSRFFPPGLRAGLDLIAAAGRADPIVPTKFVGTASAAGQVSGLEPRITKTASVYPIAVLTRIQNCWCLLTSPRALILRSEYPQHKPGRISPPELSRQDPRPPLWVGWGLAFYLIWGVFAEKQRTAVVKCRFSVEF